MPLPLPSAAHARARHGARPSQATAMTFLALIVLGGVFLLGLLHLG
jgi:hypothetical protein